ncbi:MAG: hypothetical protein HY929_05210 [Euryarchaeota archaeon]|nr:hypothetical protein [Euryarchaeota archaeon]
MEKLTYEKLRQIQHEEQNSSRIQAVDENFYEMLQNYIQELQKAYSESQKKGFSSNVVVLEDELKNARRAIETIYDIRERKIVLQAMATARSKKETEIENLTPEEKKLFEALVKGLKEQRDQFLIKILSGEQKPELPIKIIEMPKIEQKAPVIPITLIRFVKNIDAIVGVDGKTYGAFKNEDIAALPALNAKVLIERGVAREINLKT